MIDQQPSKTPTTDEAEALGPVTVLETCRAFEVGIKELRQRISTTNAEVERLRQWEQALTEAAERLNTRVMELRCSGEAGEVCNELLLQAGTILKLRDTTKEK